MRRPLRVASSRTSLGGRRQGLGCAQSDLAEVREGYALETLRDVGGEVDMLLLDGDFSLYLPVLKLVEPRLRTGALVLAENAFDPAYLAHVRDEANGYLSQPVALDEGPRQRDGRGDPVMRCSASSAREGADALSLNSRPCRRP